MMPTCWTRKDTLNLYYAASTYVMQMIMIKLAMYYELKDLNFSGKSVYGYNKANELKIHLKQCRAR
jgi:hypothetical protein